LVKEHQIISENSITGRYKLDKLVYFETTDDITIAIEREKQLKTWVRRKKVALIHDLNPLWKDLSLELMPENEWHEYSPPRYPSPDLRRVQDDRINKTL
jgi:predicted GIY-YIG superfamily endonuclease